MITITQAIHIATEFLKNNLEIESPLNEARLILAFVLNKNKAYLIAFSEDYISEAQYENFLKQVEKRQQGIPFAYLTGYKEFWGLPLKVNQSTLIPRSDTEILIETALSLLKNKSTSINILDLGTGTGAIALSLKKELPHSNVFACDKSKDAVSLAKANADHLNLNIDIRQSDWFSEYSSEQFYQFFDLIISNPPYISANDQNLLNDGVKFEPLSALVSEKNGLKDIELIIKCATNYLKSDGRLLIEHGYDQFNDVKQLFNEYHYQKIDQLYDLNNHIRCTLGHIK